MNELKEMTRTSVPQFLVTSILDSYELVGVAPHWYALKEPGTCVITLESKGYRTFPGMKFLKNNVIRESESAIVDTNSSAYSEYLENLSWERALRKSLVVIS